MLQKNQTAAGSAAVEFTKVWTFVPENSPRFKNKKVYAFVSTSTTSCSFVFPLEKNDYKENIHFNHKMSHKK